MFLRKFSIDRYILTILIPKPVLLHVYYWTFMEWICLVILPPHFPAVEARNIFPVIMNYEDNYFQNQHDLLVCLENVS